MARAELHALNGCPMHPLKRETVTAVADSPDAGQTATRYEYAPCGSHAEITIWKLSGAGHVWPGAPSRYERLLGRATRVVDANDILWNTLSRHRRLDAPPLPVPGAAP